MELPKLLSPALNHLCDAVTDDGLDSELLDAVAGGVDEPTERARLARAVIAREQGFAASHPWRPTGSSVSTAAPG